jgi:spermidine synthase
MIGNDNRFSIPFAVTVLGISHVITQITVIREFINIFAGNEVVLGILFSLWMLLTGFGAWLGRFVSTFTLQVLLFRISLFLVAFLPIAHIFLIRFLRDYLFIRGEMPGIGPLIIWATALLTPYCLITGILLTIACTIFPSYGSGKLSIGKVYFFDNIGDILGGILFTFVLVLYFNNITILYVPAFLCLLGLLLVKGSNTRSKYFKFLWGIGGMILLGIIIFLPLENISLQWLYPGQQIVDHLESPYGRVVVTRDHDQISFFENGEHLFSTPNVFANEELVHYALPQLPDVQSVLLVSGGVSGILDEIMKYDVHTIDYVELDPSVITAGTKHLAIQFPQAVHLQQQDGRNFIYNTKNKYSAVILDLPDPTSLQLNRFYTYEFFSEVKSILLPRGTICFGVKGAENYISHDQARFLSALHNTLKKIFNHVLIIPGERNIFIASDRSLSSDIATLIASRKIQTTYVNKYYLSGRVTAERLSFVKRHIIDDVPINHDFHPTAFIYSIRIWLNMFQETFTIPLITIFLFFAIYFTRVGMVNKALFTTGFTAASMEIMILLCYQISHGSMYTGIGSIIASFMMGLAAGSYMANRLLLVTKKNILEIEAFIIIYILIFLVILIAGKSLRGILIFPVLAIAIGTLTGAEFPVASRLVYSSPRETAGSLYTADLLGGSLGAIVVSLFLVPTIGIYYTCILLAAFKILIISGLIVTLTR